MFWYIFIIIVSSIIIISAVFIGKMRKQAGELVLVETAFKNDGDRAAAGSRFCFISDVHISMMPVKWGDILSAVKGSGGEFLLITGDLVNKASEIESAKQFVMTMTYGAQIPVVITLGNHDNEVAAKLPGGKKEFIEQFTSLPGDVRVLDDECTVIGNTLIGGLNDARWRERPAGPLMEEWGAKAASEGLDFYIVTHNADLLLSVEGYGGKEAGGNEDGGDRGVDSGVDSEKLPEPKPGESKPDGPKPNGILCGHTHGGQIKMFRGLEFSILKKDLLPRRGIYYGRHTVNGFEVYITSGIGCSLGPWRSGTNPEVVVVISEPV